MRFTAYGRSEPKCRNFASSTVLLGRPPVYRRTKRRRRMSVEGSRGATSAWPNLHTYKAHSMCFRGHKSTQLRESLNPSLPQHRNDTCGKENPWMCMRWYNVTHTNAKLHGTIRGVFLVYTSYMYVYAHVHMYSRVACTNAWNARNSCSFM